MINTIWFSSSLQQQCACILNFNINSRILVMLGNYCIFTHIVILFPLSRYISSASGIFPVAFSSDFAKLHFPIDFPQWHFPIDFAQWHLPSSPLQSSMQYTMTLHVLYICKHIIILRLSLL